MSHIIIKTLELHVPEKILGHSLGRVLTVYNKYDWLDELMS
jgi:hypothetical protein